MPSRRTHRPDMIRSIRSIKARVERERLPRGEDPDFHLKLGPGGLSDIEFLAQLWQLRLGHAGTPNSRPRAPSRRSTGWQLWRHFHAARPSTWRLTYRLCTQIRNRLFLQTARTHDSIPLDGEEGARLARSLGYENRSAASGGIPADDPESPPNLRAPLLPGLSRFRANIEPGTSSRILSVASGSMFAPEWIAPKGSASTRRSGRWLPSFYPPW